MKQWEKKEKNDAKFFGGKRVKGSGNSWYAPGDVNTENFLIDSKQTDLLSYSVSKKTWNKLAEEAAFAGGKIPMLSLKIGKIELVVLSKEDFGLLMSNNF